MVPPPKLADSNDLPHGLGQTVTHERVTPMLVDHPLNVGKTAFLWCPSVARECVTGEVMVLSFEGEFFSSAFASLATFERFLGRRTSHVLYGRIR